MDFPDFFADAPTITLRDPLAVFLGAARRGVFTYTYGDAVKLAGHSCPTVAGCYLMLLNGIRALYGDDVAERGGIEVYLRQPREQGTTGVLAQIATLITGAAPETGFGGIGAQHRFTRRNLLHYSAPIIGTLALRRIDNGAGVIMTVNAGIVPPHPDMQRLFPGVISDEASDDEKFLFGTLWQGRVAQMLLNHADDPALVQVTPWEMAA